MCSCWEMIAWARLVMMGILRSSQKNCGWITSWIQASEKEWQKEDGGYGPEVGSMVMVESRFKRQFSVFNILIWMSYYITKWLYWVGNWRYEFGVQRRGLPRMLFSESSVHVWHLKPRDWMRSIRYDAYKHLKAVPGMWKVISKVWFGHFYCYIWYFELDIKNF